MAITRIIWGEINWGCHGIPERCLIVRGKRMTICARCFGATIGHVLSFVLFVIGKLPPVYIAIALLIPLALDWSLQQFFHILSTNPRRLLTGILGGFGVGSIIWTIVACCFSYLLHASKG
jgi:uncharacterized membrane protein